MVDAYACAITYPLPDPTSIGGDGPRFGGRPTKSAH